VLALPDWIAPGDVLALTALTNLTWLSFHRAMRAVDTVVATALANNLKQLKSLVIEDCGLQLGTSEGMACLEAIGRLTQLTKLDLSYNQGLAEHGMQQLTGLLNLKPCNFTCRHSGAVTHVEDCSSTDAPSATNTCTTGHWSYSARTCDTIRADKRSRRWKRWR
jgi:hypothetical protein